MKRIILFALVVFTAFGLGACGGDGSNSTPPAEVGDDTYVPDFQAGNLTFTDVWVPDTAKAGYPMDIWFDVEAEEAKYNVYVKLDLIKLPEGNASDLVIDPENYTADYELTALVLDKLESGEKRHVTHTFNVPPDIPDTTYAAVFTINQEDYYPEDDNLQGEVEEEEEDNFVVAPASIIIGTPDKPNLRVLSTELENSSFEFDGLEPVADDSGLYLSNEPVLNLNLEVESMAQDTVEPVDIIMDLEIDGISYPLWFTQEDDQGEPVMTRVWTYEQICREMPVEQSFEEEGERGLDPQEKEEIDPAEATEVQMEERCASLFRQSQVGQTHHLYLGEDAALALESRTEDTPCNLIVTVDPEQIVSEWENNTSDNTKVLPVIYLPPTSEDAPVVQSAAYSSMGPYGENIFNKSKRDVFGNGWFGAGYEAGPRLNWRRNSDGAPVAGYMDLRFTARSTLFGSTGDLFSVWQKADMNVENIDNSYFDYGASIYGSRIWGANTSMSEDAVAGQVKPMQLWSSKDRRSGVEKYRKSKLFFDKAWWYFPYGIPIKVTAKASGEVGLRGRVFVDPYNTLGLEGGPYVKADGNVDGGVSAGVARAGLGGAVNLMDIYQKGRATLQLQPTMPMATARLEAPTEVKTLAGRFYLFGERIKWKRWKYYWKRKTATIFRWNGWHYERHWFNPRVKSYTSRQFTAEYFDNQHLSGSPRVTRRENAIDHSWYRSGPDSRVGREYFSARWTGDFNFSDGDYRFVALTDDGFRLYVDGEMVLDKWFGQAATQYEVTVPMTEGEHEIKVEYYQGRGGAVAKLLWYKD